jgi:hypothetical protein
MGPIKNDIIGGVNSFIEAQRKVTGEATINIAQFDDVYEQLASFQNIQDVPLLTTASYQPRSATALNDAICKAINETGAALAAMPEKDRPSRVVVLIVTDGFENASKEFTGKDVHQKIEHQKKDFKWEFVFLGSNQDAIKTGDQIGVQAGNSMTYANNAVGIKRAFDATANNLTAMRCQATDTMAYSQSQRDEQTEAGA